MPFQDVAICTKTEGVTGAIKDALDSALAGTEVKVVEHNAVRQGLLKQPCQRFGAYICETNDDAHVLEVYTKAFHRQAYTDKLVCVVNADPEQKKYADKDERKIFSTAADLAAYLKAKNA